MIFLQNFIQRECYAIGGCAVDRPVTLVDLADAQRAGQRETVGSAAHFRSRRHDIDVADLFESFLEFNEAIRIDAVVVCEQDPDHTNYLARSTLTSGGSLTQERPIRNLCLRRLVR